MARTEGDYKHRATIRAKLRSARNGKRPGGKPEGFCTVPGCTEFGSPCWYPDYSGESLNRPPDEYRCDAHLKHSGFCKGCGNFWGGVESFDFATHGHDGFCDNCASQIDAEERRERWWDGDDDDDDPHDAYCDDDAPGQRMVLRHDGGYAAMGEAAAAPDLGPCCACGEPSSTVRNILMLPLRAPHPGTGWGCVVCGLPNDGALAVVCDACLDAKREPTEVCVGFVTERTHARAHRRSREYLGTFEHDVSKH